jgi:hypothetical protein
MLMNKIPRTDETTPPLAKPPAPGPSTSARRSSRLQTLGMIGLIGAAVLVIAALTFLRRSDSYIAVDNVPGRAEPAGDVSGSLSASAARPPMAASAGLSAAGGTSVVKTPSKKASAPKPGKNRAASSAALSARIPPMRPSADSPEKEDVETMPVASESTAAAAAPASSSTAALVPAPATITGCLEVSVDQNEFRLTDTEGVNAPKARSWRTGFLKKRHAPVALIEPPDPHGLQKQVGKRVAATGLLTSNELKVSSLQVLGASCN